MLTEVELTSYAAAFLKKNYQLDLAIPIKRNNRLRSTLGRYCMSKDQTPLRIEIAGNTLTYGSKTAIYGILRHECIHYALHMQGRRTNDGDAFFEGELKKHDAPSTNTMKIGKYVVFQCSGCGKKGETRLQQLAKTPEKYRSNCCQAELTIESERIYRGY